MKTLTNETSNSTILSESNLTSESKASNISSGHIPIYPGWKTIHVYGLPGYRFYLIHITAFVFLSLSITSSAGVLIYLNFPFKKNLKNFFTRSIGERLVVYLAFCDLMFSSSHVLDHATIAATKEFPSDATCRTFAFFLLVFMCAQTIIVNFTAVNAMLMVVFGKRISLGRYDWKLNVLAFGTPSAIGAIALSLKLLGPSGPWCYVDLRNPKGPDFSNIVSMFVLVAFLINLLGYASVFLKMRSVELRLKKGQEETGNGSVSNKYHGTARIMMLFVLVYITQYWALVVYGIWLIAGDPPVGIYFATVVFSNLGGILNVLAYTVVRRKQQSVKPSES